MAGFPHLIEAVEDLPDPRRGQGQRYPFEFLLLSSIFAMMSGALTYQSIRTYIQERREILNEFFDLRLKRAPALNTIRTLIQRLDPARLEHALRAHATRLLDATRSPDIALVIALDGKTLRGSHDQAKGQAAAQMLSAFATKAALVLAQLDIADKSNEIPAAQDMIRSLDLKNAVFTADAIHCQKNIRSCQGYR